MYPIIRLYEEKRLQEFKDRNEERENEGKKRSNFLSYIQGASLDAIKKVYKKLSLIYHPDKADDPTDSAVQTRYINLVKAYETLTGMNIQLLLIVYDTKELYLRIYVILFLVTIRPKSTIN
jgi:hypothetical protein